MVEVRGSCGENQEAHDKQAADLLAQAAKAAPIERSALENRPPIRSRPPRNRLSARTKEPFGLRCQEVLRRYFQLWPGTPVRCNAAILLVAGLLVGFSAHHSGSDRRKSGLSWRMLKPTRMTVSDHAAYARRAASHHRCCIG
jgi:hypothetical protein